MDSSIPASDAARDHAAHLTPQHERDRGSLARSPSDGGRTHHCARAAHSCQQRRRAPSRPRPRGAHHRPPRLPTRPRSVAVVSSCASPVCVVLCVVWFPVVRRCALFRARRSLRSRITPHGGTTNVDRQHQPSHSTRRREAATQQLRLTTGKGGTGNSNRLCSDSHALLSALGVLLLCRPPFCR